MKMEGEALQRGVASAAIPFDGERPSFSPARVILAWSINSIRQTGSVFVRVR